MTKLACGCPGSQVRKVDAPENNNSEASGRLQSELRQWPTQLHLVPPSAPWLENADLLVAADCARLPTPSSTAISSRGRSWSTPVPSSMTPATTWRS